jgi:branched-chain amino acid transport system ATP-binding protein
VLEIKDVCVSYGDMAVLQNICMQVEEGEIVAVIGANCAGKSTLLKSICSLRQLNCGEVRFEGTVLNNLPPHKVIELGAVLSFEGRRLFPIMTVEENLMLGAYAKRARPFMKSSLAEVYELFPRLAERRKQFAHSLSGGEQQMLAIGRGIMARPKLLMLDEPSLGLAPILLDEIFEKVVAINKGGVTIMLVEQNVHLSLEICTRGYVLENGRIVMDGDRKYLSNNDEVKRCYLGIC